jgi:fructose-specific PTS system IIA-like component
LVGVRAAQHTKLEGQQVVLDADAGILVLNPDAATRRYYELEFHRIADREAYLAKAGENPAVTKDGHRLEIAANTASAEETERAFALGAEGIGLFRSEMLFFDRDGAPDEEEQFQTYRKLLHLAKGWPVIIRTLDAGGDKPLPYLKLPAEDNPALGYRAVRIYGEFESLFRTQIRALLRASAFGQVKILIPMVATVDEARWVKKIISEEQIRCKKDGIPVAANIPIGAMIEVPAAAFAMEALAHEFDFFSIGTNDLLQYFAATDRADSRLAHLYSPANPAFLRLLKQIVDNARALGKWIGLCGEMAGQTRLLPLLAGLGLDEISVGAMRIRDLKLELAVWETAECRQLLSAALNCQTAKEVDELLARTVSSTEAPLIDPELIVLEAVAPGKMEAIKLASDKLYVLGRTENPRELEQAVWEREQLGSTGFGHEFAIPHCKSDAVRSNSLVLVKFKTPVEWDSLDEQPVKVMILLAIRLGHADSKHMAILARLARRIVDDAFREKIVSTNSSEQLAAILKSSVEDPSANHRGAGSSAVLRE